MALFKINRGNSTTLPSDMTDGWAYFCTDTGEFFIDYADANGVLCRKQINADEAKKLSGMTVEQILSSSQADWSVNDDTAADYIKNRTHYEEIKEVILVDNLSSTEETFPVCTLIAGDTYKVIWNGVEYECVCFADGYWKCLAIGGYDIANQYRYRSPFLIQVYDGDGQLMVESYEDSIESWTVSIIHVQKATHQIDPKYIKDMYYEEEYEIDDEALAITFEDKYSDLVIHTFAGDELSRFRDVLDNNSEVTVNVNGTLYTTECRGFDRGYYRLYYNDFVIFECYTGNAPIKISFRYEAIGLESPPVNAKVIFYKTVASEKIHHIHPKYIKDMYYDNDISVLKTRSEITDIINTYGYDVTFRVVVNGVVYDNVPVHADCYVAGGYTWGIGDRFSSSPSGHHWYTTYYGFCVSGYGTVPNSDIFQNGINKVEVYTVEREFKQIDSKFIKDMYHEESIEVFSVENATFDGNQYVPETPFAIVDGNTYIVNWDGVEYTCDAYTLGGTPAIGNTVEFGGQGNGEPFNIGYISFDNLTFVNSLDDLATHTFSVTEIVRHTIAPKYIKDMYYENKIHYLVDGNFVNININQTYTVKVKDDVYENIPVNMAGSDNEPRWGFGSDSGSFTSYPFCIRRYPSYPTNNNDILNGRCNVVIFDTTVYPDVTIDDVEIYQINLKQIDAKYLPIFEEGTGIIFEATDIVSGTELFGSNYQMILGDYTIVVDGISETVEFFDDGGAGIAECERYLIATFDGGMYVEFLDEEPHSLQIIGKKDVVKKEYLPYSVVAQPDWNQNAPDGNGYIKNRTHYDEAYIPLTIVESTGHASGYLTHKVGPYTWDYDKAITVRVDGVTYAFDEFTDDGYASTLGYHIYKIGAPHKMGQVSDSSEYPFTIIVFKKDEEYAHIAFADGTDNHTVEIFEGIKQLDEKYIPDTIARKEDINKVVSIEPQNLTEEQKLQAQNNISFIKWYRFTHPHTKQIRQFSYDDSFDMNIANSILNVTGYGDNCSAMEDIADYVISVLYTNADTEKDLKDLWLRVMKVYIKPNFDALQEIGCFKGSSFTTYLDNDYTKMFVSKNNTTYKLNINSNLRNCAIGSVHYDSSTDTLTYFTINNLEWNDTTLTKPNYHANAKAVGDALALKVDKSDIASDDEIIDMLTQEDMFPVVADFDGALLSDENENILLW